MKNTIKVITFAMVLSLGATFANAGILVTDRSNNAAGILVTDRSDSAAGILVTDLSSQPCSEGRGIVVTDIFGTMASVVGILVTDLTGRTETCTSSTMIRNSISKNGVTNSLTGILVTD